MNAGGSLLDGPAIGEGSTTDAQGKQLLAAVDAVNEVPQFVRVLPVQHVEVVDRFPESVMDAPLAVSEAIASSDRHWRS
jgi:hypothetical protein